MLNKIVKEKLLDTYKGKLQEVKSGFVPRISNVELQHMAECHSNFTEGFVKAVTVLCGEEVGNEIMEEINKEVVLDVIKNIRELITEIKQD